MTIQIVPSILAADFANLERAVRDAEQGGANAVQIDVMDGHFVPNLTVGPPVVASLRKVTDLVLDVHLMIENPGMFVDDFVRAGTDILTVHVEACTHLHRVLEQIKGAGIRAGVALNPATPLVTVEEVVGEIDLLLIMTVNPGFGGQAFITAMLDKVARATEMLARHGREDVIVQVDGGVGEENARQLGAAGATWLVAGSSVYRGDEPVGVQIEQLRALAMQGRSESRNKK